jgi:hypothetical protein
MEVNDQVHFPATGIHSKGGWVDPRASLNTIDRNFLPLQKIELRFFGYPDSHPLLHGLGYTSLNFVFTCGHENWDINEAHGNKAARAEN